MKKFLKEWLVYILLGVLSILNCRCHVGPKCDYYVKGACIIDNTSYNWSENQQALLEAFELYIEKIEEISNFSKKQARSSVDMSIIVLFDDETCPFPKDVYGYYTPTGNWISLLINEQLPIRQSAIYHELMHNIQYLYDFNHYHDYDEDYMHEVSMFYRSFWD